MRSAEVAAAEQGEVVAAALPLAEAVEGEERQAG